MNKNNQIKAVILLSLIVLHSAIVCSQVNQSYRWGNLPIGGGGFVSGIITSKTQRNLMYARTDVGGAYRFDSINSSWIPLLDWTSESETGYQGVESLAIDPTEPNRVYMSVGTDYFNSGKSAILRSTDYGATFSITEVTSKFKVHGNGMGRNTGEKLAVDPNSGNILFCGSRRNGLFKSTDYGASWNKVSSLAVSTTNNDNGISFVIFDPSSGSTASPTQTLIVGVSRMGSTNIYRSDDGGATFNAIANQPTTYMPCRAALAKNSKQLYITYANGGGPFGTTAEPTTAGQIWKYDIQTGLWTSITPSSSTAYCGISVDPNNENRVVATTINTYWAQGTGLWGDRIFLSTNGGGSWVDVINRGYSFDSNGITWATGGQSIHWAASIEFDPFNTARAFVVSGNGIFMTENIDATTNVWKFFVKGLEETVPLGLVSILRGPVVSVIGDYDGFRHTDVTQYAPIHKPTMGTTTGIAYGTLNPTVMLRTGAKMYYSADTGKTWTLKSSKGTEGNVAVSADGLSLLHCPKGSDYTYRSVDRGSNWSAVSRLLVTNAEPVADPVNPNSFYVYNPITGDFAFSANSGALFTTINTLNSWGSKHLRVVPGYEGHVWVALNSNGLTRTVNSGQSFAKITNVTACSAVGVGRHAPGYSYPTVYIWGTVNEVTGLFRSVDEGKNWVRINDDDHEYGGTGNGQFVVGDMNYFGRVYMSTVGRGIVFGQPKYDCHGDSAGLAFYDTCDSCVGGNTGKVACTENIKVGYLLIGTVSGDSIISSKVDSVQMKVLSVLPTNATYKAVSWTIIDADVSIARIDSKGSVFPLRDGIVHIVAQAADGSGVIGQARIRLQNQVYVSEMSIASASGDTIVTVLGDTLRMRTYILPNYASNKRVVWSIAQNDQGLATIDSSGVLYPLKNGVVHIFAQTTDSSGIIASTRIRIQIPVQSESTNVSGVWGGVYIYPVPSHHYFVVTFGSLHCTRIEVLDAYNRTCLEKSVAQGGSNITIAHSLPSGLYLVRVYYDGKYEVLKLIVN